LHHQLQTSTQEKLNDFLMNFLMKIKKDEEVYAFDVSKPSKNVFNIMLPEGVYLIFTNLNKKHIKFEEEFFEILFNNNVYLIRAKDAINRSV